MKLWFALLVCAAPVAAQSVRGSVVNSLTGTPINDVEVTLRFSGGPSYQIATDAQGGARTVSAAPTQPYQVATDLQGEFRIDDLKPGRYTASFSRRGFLAPSRTSEAVRPFQVSAGGQPVSLRAEMIPLAKLSGRVLDAAGNAVKDANVQLSPVAGPTIDSLLPIGGPASRTDNQGNFHIEEIRPATYTLVARPPRNTKPIESADGQRRVMIPTYFPASAERAGAERIQLAPGAEVWGQDIRLIAAPAHRIRGKVVDEKGDPADLVTVKLIDPLRSLQQDAGQVVSVEGGAFEFPAVVDGEWSIFAQRQRGELQMKALQQAQMAGHDIERIELRLALPFAVSGSVGFEPAGATPPGRPVSVMFYPVGAGNSEHVTALIEDGGRFTGDGMYPGTYQVVPAYPGPAFYLDSIRLGEREYPDGMVEFSSGAPPLRIVYRSDGGTVRGTVEECRSATVVLVPQPLALRRRDLIHRAGCRATGQYEIRVVRPGEYLVFALDAGDAAFDQGGISPTAQQLAGAQSVTVRANESTSVDLKVLTAR